MWPIRLIVVVISLACLWFGSATVRPLGAASLPESRSGKALYATALNRLQHVGRLVYEERQRQLVRGRFINNRYIVHYIAPDRIDIVQEIQSSSALKGRIELRQIGKRICNRRQTKWSCRTGSSRTIDIRALISARLLGPQFRHVVYSRTGPASSNVRNLIISVHVAARQDVPSGSQPTRIRYGGRTITVRRYNLSAVLMVRGSDMAPLSYQSQVTVQAVPLDQRLASFTYGGRFTIANPK